MRPMLCCLLLCACASAPAVRTDGEEILERGGDLSLQAPPAANSAIEGGRLVAWAQSEVPGDSRLQAALALVDSLARAELLKVLQVELTTSDEVVTTADNGVERQAATFAVAERARGALAQAEPPQHGWARVRRGGKVVLRVYARASIARPQGRR